MVEEFGVYFNLIYMCTIYGILRLSRQTLCMTLLSLAKEKIIKK